MKTMFLAAVAATAIVAAAPASAATFTVDTSKTFAKVANGASLCFGCNVTSKLASFTSFDLNQGQSKTFDFATFTFSGFGAATADIDAQLAFSNPFASAVNADGNATYFRGIFTTTGLLTWDNPVQVFNGADGSRFSVTLNNLAGIGAGGTFTTRATVSLLAAAVPEPATWAMMLVGFGMVAGAARYRRRSANVTYA